MHKNKLTQYPPIISWKITWIDFTYLSYLKFSIKIYHVFMFSYNEWRITANIKGGCQILHNNGNEDLKTAEEM